MESVNGKAGEKKLYFQYIVEMKQLYSMTEPLNTYSIL